MFYPSSHFNKWIVQTIVLFILILIILPSSLAYADNNSNILPIISSQSEKLSVIKEVGKPLDLEELGLEYWHIAPENTPTDKQLIQLSVRLRDIARYLGVNWPVFIPLSNSQMKNTQTDANGRLKRLITGFRESDGVWTTLTAGQTLKLITKELQILKNLEAQPLIDFLVRDGDSDREHPINGVPLVRYCYEVLKIVKFNS